MTGETTNTPKADAAANSFVPGRVGVVGLGLMGGSFARAFRAAGVDVYAWNRTKSTLELAEIETVRGELDDKTIPTCELIVLAGYPQSAIDWLAEKAGLIADGTIVIDTVGVKRVICEKCGARYAVVQPPKYTNGWNYDKIAPASGRELPEGEPASDEGSQAPAPASARSVELRSQPNAPR